MTIGDYVKLKMSQWSFEYSEQLLLAEMQAVGLDPESEYNENTKIDELFYKILPDVLFAPTSVSEGGYSISYDKEGMLAYYRMIARNLGKPDQTATQTIKDITKRWL